MRLRHIQRAGGLLLAGVAATALLAGCGGSSKPTATSSTASGGTDSSLATYVACLNTNGAKVSLPTGGPGGAGRPSGATGARPTRTPGARPSQAAGGGFGGGIFGDANNPPAGVDQATWTKAMAACKSLQPTFGGGAGSGGGGGNSAFAAYRNCLQSHGVSASSGTSLNTADPKVAAAVKTCAPLRPAGNASTAPSTSG